MYFGFSKKKITLSIIIGIIIGFIITLRFTVGCFGDCTKTSVNIFSFISFVSFLIVYVIWSLAEEKRE